MDEAEIRWQIGCAWFWVSGRRHRGSAGSTIWMRHWEVLSFT